MITVQVERNQADQTIRSFTMSGHANSGPHGEDIVCAGASAVAFGAINAVAELCQFEPMIDMEEDGGFLRCMLPTEIDKDAFEKAQLLIEGMLVALRSIEAQYRQFITINDSRR